MKLSIYIITSLLLFNTELQLWSQPDINIESQLYQRIDTYMEQNTTNGYFASVLLALGEDILLSKGYGWADREKQIANSPSTVFNIGSITKQFTAAALLKLVEEDKVNLIDSLDSFYQDIPSHMGVITLHQLLTHTSGIAVSTGGFRYDPANKKKFLEVCFSAPLRSIPGTSHEYANANYILLADIIEKVSGMQYEGYLNKMLWKPAGLTSTVYRETAAADTGFAEGNYFHYSTGKWRSWGVTADYLPAEDQHWFSIGKGDIQSTTEDLYRWHLALEKDLIFSKQTKRLLEFPHVPEDEKGNSHYGYGWAISQTGSGEKVVWHNGSNGIYFGNFLRFQDSGLVVIVLSNTILNSDSELVAWEIARMARDESYVPEPVTPLSYELVFDFMDNHTPAGAGELPDFLKAKLRSPLTDKAVLNRIGYKQAEQGSAWGVALLKLNTQLFPEDGNVWDSLGEAYFMAEMRLKAIDAFENALSRAPADNCHWCENAEMRLAQLRQ